MRSGCYLSGRLVVVAATLVAGTIPQAESASRSSSPRNPAPLSTAHPQHVAFSSRLLVAHARPRDTEPPVLTLTEPVEAAIVTTPTTTVRGTVSDEDSAVTVHVQGHRVPLTRQGVWRMINGLVAAVGLDPRYATYSSRHTYATHLYLVSGGDLEVVREQLGYASVKTTTIYAKITKEDKARAADALAKAYRDSQQNSASGASWLRSASRSARCPDQTVGSV